VAFNRGDAVFWPEAARLIAFREPLDAWPARVAGLIGGLGITDLVLYGDTRPVHARAILAARAAGVSVHVFEEGYLRPYWITYERDGANGHSRLMRLPVAAMRAALAREAGPEPDAPATWGDLRQHVGWGALYHFLVLTGGRAWPHFAPHRNLTVGQELAVHLRRLALFPAHRWARMLAERRIRHSAFPYHLALLQLEHDASFRHHSPFATLAQFLEVVLTGFAEGAPAHHHLVVKAHPLEDGRSPVAQDLARLARARGLSGRVHFVRGGKLAGLLSRARSVVTVNSTAGQQALRRGIPVRTFGAAVYAKPEFVSDQPLPEFFADPARPDLAAYRDFRRFLLETSQIPGGFYSARGRRDVLRHVIDLMLAPADPYEARLAPIASSRQQLRLAN
jgi:capsular polysaccharide export protein